MPNLILIKCHTQSPTWVLLNYKKWYTGIILITPFHQVIICGGSDCRGCANQYLIPWMTWNRLTYQQIPRTPSGTFRREEELLQSIRNISARRKLRDKNSYTEAVQSNRGVNQKRWAGMLMSVAYECSSNVMFLKYWFFSVWIHAGTMTAVAVFT